MTDILSKIKAYKLEEIAAAKLQKSQADIERECSELEHTPRGFIKAIEEKLANNQTALIAEIKKASPSKGIIREDFNPSDHAKQYETGGAACLSVLTDTPSFQGRFQHLTDARAACKLPIIRKDFIFDPYQIFEAKLMGADAILLIMAALSLEQAKQLNECAQNLSLDVLVEVHNLEELEAGLELDTKLIGINNRDLKTFHTDLNTSIKLAKHIPGDRIIVGESGIYTPKDVEKLAVSNINTILVGESLMRQADVSKATQDILTK